MPRLGRAIQGFLMGRDSPMTLQNAVVLVLIAVLSLAIMATIGRAFEVAIGRASSAIGKL